MNFFLAWVGALLLPAPTGFTGDGLDYLDAVISHGTRFRVPSCSISC